MVAYGLARIIVIVVNSVFLSIGLVGLLCGIMFTVAWRTIREVFKDHDLLLAGDMVAGALISFSILIVILSILGFVGAQQESKAVPIVYIVLLSIMILIQATVSGIAMSKADVGDLGKDLRSSFYNYKEFSPDVNSKSWNSIFSSFECCGVVNFIDDYAKTAHRHTKGRVDINHAAVIPINCCLGVDHEKEIKNTTYTKYKDCLENPTSKNAYMTGCKEQIEEAVYFAKICVTAVSISIILLELALVVLSIYLLCFSSGVLSW